MDSGIDVKSLLYEGRLLQNTDREALSVFFNSLSLAVIIRKGD
jgi:hypothetical protein